MVSVLTRPSLLPLEVPQPQVQFSEVATYALPHGIILLTLPQHIAWQPTRRCGAIYSVSLTP